MRHMGPHRVRCLRNGNDKPLINIIDVCIIYENTALDWYAGGAGFESPRVKTFVLIPSVLSLPLV